MFQCGGGGEYGKGPKGPWNIPLCVLFLEAKYAFHLTSQQYAGKNQADTEQTPLSSIQRGQRIKKDRHMRFHWANWLRILMFNFCAAKRDFCMVSDRLMHVMNNKWNGEQMSSLIIWLLSFHFLFYTVFSRSRQASSATSFNSDQTVRLTKKIQFPRAQHFWK